MFSFHVSDYYPERMNQMPNERGWFNKEEAYATGLPIFIKTSDTVPGHWTHEPYPHAVLLTRTRCKQLGMPIILREAPCAFKYLKRNASNYCYVPLYDRTSVFESGELSYSILKEGEIMGLL